MVPRTSSCSASTLSINRFCASTSVDFAKGAGGSFPSSEFAASNLSIGSNGLGSVDMAPVLAHKLSRSLEPYHGIIYFLPEATEAYAALGVTGRDGYFASRSAPLGQATPEVVIA